MSDPRAAPPKLSAEPAPSAAPPPAQVPRALSAKGSDARKGARDARAAEPQPVWPAGVLPLEQLQSAFAGPAGAPPALAEFLARFQEGLSEEERTLLLLADAPPPLEPIRTALTVCARLELALATRPTPLESISDAALETLLSESDAALTALRLPDGAGEAAQASTQALRAALVRAAVQLTESAAQVVKAQAATTAKKQVDEKYSRITRMVAAEAGKSSIPRRQLLLYAVFGVLLVAAGAYQGARWLHRPKPVVTEGLPDGTTGMVAPGGVTMVEVPRNDRARIEEVRKELQERADAEGKRLVEPAPGQFLLVPAPGPAASSEVSHAH